MQGAQLRPGYMLNIIHDEPAAESRKVGEERYQDEEEQSPEVGRGPGFITHWRDNGFRGIGGMSNRRGRCDAAGARPSRHRKTNYSCPIPGPTRAPRF